MRGSINPAWNRTVRRRREASRIKGAAYGEQLGFAGHFRNNVCRSLAGGSFALSRCSIRLAVTRQDATRTTPDAHAFVPRRGGGAFVADTHRLPATWNLLAEPVNSTSADKSMTFSRKTDCKRMREGERERTHPPSSTTGENDEKEEGGT